MPDRRSQLPMMFVTSPPEITAPFSVVTVELAVTIHLLDESSVSAALSTMPVSELLSSRSTVAELVLSVTTFPVSVSPCAVKVTIPESTASMSLPLDSLIFAPPLSSTVAFVFLT